VRDTLRATRPEAVVNLAALRRGDPDTMTRTNVAGSVALLAAVHDLVPSALVVHFGSAAEYGASGHSRPLVESDECRPSSAYGLTKLAATRAVLSLAELWQLRAVVLRPFNIIGAGCPTDLLVGALIERVLGTTDGSPIPVGRKDSSRDFVAVEDVAAAVVSVVSTPRAAGLYNVCTGRAVTVRQILATLSGVVDRPIEWRTDPELVRDKEATVSIGSPSRLAEATGFVARRSLEDAVAAAWRHAASTHHRETARP
jgi:GDP-4-dehydro-6-deoxy-D-mannose reductase